MHRFFIPPEWIEDDRVQLVGEFVHQIRNVLRMVPGDRIVVLDDSGWEMEVELTAVERDQVSGQIVHRRLSNAEPRTKISLYQGVLKGQHFEWVLQKGTELGVVEFIPVISERSVIDALGDVEKKFPRWQRIIREAAEQSRRGNLPHLQPPMMFTAACDRASRMGGLALIPWEEEKEMPLREVLSSQNPKPFTVSIFIGPEGGFSKKEADLAQRYGIVPVSLGPRILRAETAGLVAASAILYAFGDMAPVG